jgi:hypothetical protein
MLRLRFNQTGAVESRKHYIRETWALQIFRTLGPGEAPPARCGDEWAARLGEQLGRRSPSKPLVHHAARKGTG